MISAYCVAILSTGSFVDIIPYPPTPTKYPVSPTPTLPLKTPVKVVAPFSITAPTVNEALFVNSKTSPIPNLLFVGLTTEILAAPFDAFSLITKSIK